MAIVCISVCWSSYAQACWYCRLQILSNCRIVPILPVWFGQHALKRWEVLGNVFCPKKNRAWCDCRYKNACYLLCGGLEDVGIEGEDLACCVELFQHRPMSFCNSVSCWRGAWMRQSCLQRYCAKHSGSSCTVASSKPRLRNRIHMQLDLLQRAFVHWRSPIMVGHWRYPIYIQCGRWIIDNYFKRERLTFYVISIEIWISMFVPCGELRRSPKWDNLRIKIWFFVDLF